MFGLGLSSWRGWLLGRFFKGKPWYQIYWISLVSNRKPAGGASVFCKKHFFYWACELKISRIVQLASGDSTINVKHQMLRIHRSRSRKETSQLLSSQPSRLQLSIDCAKIVVAGVARKNVRHRPTVEYQDTDDALFLEKDGIFQSASHRPTNCSKRLWGDSRLLKLSVVAIVRSFRGRSPDTTSHQQ